MNEQLGFVAPAVASAGNARPEAASGDIRDWDAALASRCNWGWLRGAFGGTITPSDIDFIVERRGHFLIGEIKPNRESITEGQDILLRRLAQLPRSTVFYLVGKVVEHQIWPKEIKVLPGPNAALAETWNVIDRQNFLRWCERWYRPLA